MISSNERGGPESAAAAPERHFHHACTLVSAKDVAMMAMPCRYGALWTRSFNPNSSAVRRWRMQDEGTFYFIAIGLLLICGFITSAIAQPKGRSAGGWFVLGFLFGPLAILAVAMISPIRQSGATPASDELRKLAALHRDGILSDDEFQSAKARLLR